MRRRGFLRLGSGEAIGGAAAACGALPAPIAIPIAPHAGTVRGWNQLALRALRETQSGPSASAHALALLHTCMYNAWAAYDADARQTMHGRAVRLPRAERSAASKAGAISHAAHRALCDRLPSQKTIFDGRMAALGLDPSRPDSQFTPAGIGRTQAIAMLDFCRRSGADAVDEPAAGLPFAPVSPDASRPKAPTTPRIARDRGADPASHWCRLAQQLSARAGYDDDRDVLLYFVLANALADANIAGADADAAADAALRGFTGSDGFDAGSRIGAAESAAQELGRQVGARVLDKARRYWQGKL